MAGGKGGTGSDPAQVGPVETYFTKDEAFWIKKTAIGLGHSVTGIKFDVEFLKASVTAMAVGFTVLKADFTVLKVDEKGMTFLGRQKYTWPWADKKKSLEERLQKTQDKALKSEESVQSKLVEMKDKIDSMQRNRAEATRLGQATGNSPAAVRMREESFMLRAEVGKEKRQAEKLGKEIEEELEKISKKRVKIVNARRDLQDLAMASRASDQSREQISRNANIARRELEQLGNQL